MIEIIPAIDLIDGKCVRLSQGTYHSCKVYSDKPLDIAKAFEDNGIRRLHLVDLDGAKAAHIVNYKTLENIARHTSLTIDFGGGIKSDSDLKTAFACGAQMVTIGSVAVTQSQLFTSWIQRYGAERIILGADVRNEQIAINGWTEDSKIHIFPFLEKYQKKGISQILCTDIGRDGMLQGPSLLLYKKIMSQQPSLYLIASGGISSIKDIYQLNEAGIPATVIGKAIYENRIKLQELNHFIAKHGDI